MSEATSDTLESSAGELADAEAQEVIQAIEPILKNVKRKS